MNGYEVLNDILVAAGVKSVFTYMAEDTQELVVDLTVNRDEVEVVHSRHEQGAMAMADAYARSGSRIGVCVVGRGPGVAQTGTANLNARKGGSPVLVIVPTPGQADPHDRKLFEQEQFLQSTIGSVITAHSEDTVIPEFKRAIRQVNQESTPVAFQIPKNILKDPIRNAESSLELEHVAGLAEGKPNPHIAPRFDPAQIEPDEELLEEAVEHYLDSDAYQPPAILVGDGAATAEAKPAIEALAERLNGILLTTLKGRDYFRDHPYAIGFSGSWGEPLSNEFLTEANYVLAIGCSLNNHTVDDGYLVADDATIVHIDADPTSIGQYLPVDVGIVGDAKRTVEALNDRFAEAGIDRGDDLWTDSLRNQIAEYAPLDEIEGTTRSDVVDQSELIKKLEDVLPENRLVGSDGGNFRKFALVGISASPAHSIMGCDFSAIGLGLPMGIGIGQYLKDNNRDPGDEDPRVAIAFCGDGGFMMSVQELGTAARHDIPIIVVVGNDSSLGSEYHHLDIDNFHPEVAQIETPNIAQVADALGATGHRITSLSDVDDIAGDLQQPTGPIVLECIIDPTIRHHSY